MPDMPASYRACDAGLSNDSSTPRVPREVASRLGVRRGRRFGFGLFLALTVAASAQGAFTLIGLTIDDSATRNIVEGHTLARDLPAVRFLGTVKMVDWLMDRPTLAAALARHLHPPLERYQIAMRDDGSFAVNDLGNLRGSLRLVARGANRRVYFCQGEFRSLAHILRLSGGMVFTLEYLDSRQGTDPTVEVTPKLYVRLDNVLVHGMLKIISPLLHGVIDRRVANLTLATQAIGERITRDPEGLYREMQTWQDILPEDLEAYRQAFVMERFSR
jgi:hypothetical protein